GRDLAARGGAGELAAAGPGAGGVTTRRLRERGREEQGGEEGEGSGEQRPAAAAGAAGRGGGRGWVHVVLQSRTARSEARRARGRRSVGPSMLAARCATPARPSPAALTRLTRRGPILAWLDQRSGACEVTMRRWSLHLPFGLLLGLVACVAPPPLGVVEGEATAVGGGVAGAEATLVPAGAVATDGSRSVRTDASGAFVFERVPPGEYGLTVIAAADGLGAHVPAVSVARDETTSVPVALTPLGGITAAVDVSDRAVRPDGELVIDAFLVGTPLTARVDAAGSLVLEGVPEGGFELSLRSAGYATVAVPVTVAAGEVLAVPETVVLRRLAPYARFDLVRFGDTVEVDASASFAVDGGGLRYAWEFGDGATASGRTATHTYFRGGSMTIRLTVTDDEGNSDSVTQQIEVTTPRVPAGSSRGAVVAEPTLAPGQMAELEVAPTAGGPLLYLEVPAGGYLEATQGGATYYASTPDRFSRGSLLDDTTGPAGADLAPQAI